MRVVRSPDRRKRYIMLRLGVGVCYAEKNGRLVLRGEASWRKINGFWFNTPWGCWWLVFRRDWKHGLR